MTARGLCGVASRGIAPRTWELSLRSHGVLEYGGTSGRRHLHMPVYYAIPLIYVGLLGTLYVWKSAMMIMFQNLIIYNPYLPPNARRMRIADFVRQDSALQWSEERIRSLDGTEVALGVCETSSAISGCARTPVYILYLQGNASSLPPRLPGLSAVLRRLANDQIPADYTMVCVSYRGYWTSHDRPSEKGINMDTEAALQWITRRHEAKFQDDGDAPQPVVVLWGQSVGCGFATNLAATTHSPPNMQIDALVLETPFTSIKDMLREMYPQKWLPYRYLWPFARTHLDSTTNFGKIAKNGSRMSVHLVEAARDELVPADHGRRLQQRCESLGLAVTRARVRGAFHNGAMERPEGRDVIARSILSAVALGSTRKDVRAREEGNVPK